MDDCHSFESDIYDISGNALTAKSVGASFVTGPDENPTGAVYFSLRHESYIEIPHRKAFNFRRSMSVLISLYVEDDSATDATIFTYVVEDPTGGDVKGLHLRQLLSENDLILNLVDEDLNAAEAYVYRGNALVRNAWNYVGFTYNYDTGMAAIYVGGSMLGTEKHVGKRHLATDGKIRVGPIAGENAYYSGRVACLRIFDRALSAEEVALSEDCPVGKL